MASSVERARRTQIHCGAERAFFHLSRGGLADGDGVEELGSEGVEVERAVAIRAARPRRCRRWRSSLPCRSRARANCGPRPRTVTCAPSPASRAMETPGMRWMDSARLRSGNLRDVLRDDRIHGADANASFLMSRTLRGCGDSRSTTHSYLFFPPPTRIPLSPHSHAFDRPGAVAGLLAPVGIGASLFLGLPAERPNPINAATANGMLHRPAWRAPPRVLCAWSSSPSRTSTAKCLRRRKMTPVAKPRRTSPRSARLGCGRNRVPLARGSVLFPRFPGGFGDFSRLLLPAPDGPSPHAPAGSSASIESRNDTGDNEISKPPLGDTRCSLRAARGRAAACSGAHRGRKQ